MKSVFENLQALFWDLRRIRFARCRPFLNEKNFASTSTILLPTTDKPYFRQCHGNPSSKAMTPASPKH